MKSFFFKTIFTLLKFISNDINKYKLRFILKLYFSKTKLFWYNISSRNPKLSIFFKIAGSDKFKQYSGNYDLISNFLSRKSKYNILEIGIGGHNKKFEGGNSLLALSSYFYNSKVIGADIEDKSFLNNKNIETVILNQGNIKSLTDLGNRFNFFDIIIDDGSHFCDHQRISFEVLFKYLSDGGIYVIEDMSGSYEVGLRGDPDLHISKNNITYFSSMCHSVNSHMLYKEKYNDQKFIDIDSILFFPKMVIILKKTKKHKIVTKEYLNISTDQYSNRKNEDGLVDYNKEKIYTSVKQFEE